MLSLNKIVIFTSVLLQQFISLTATGNTCTSRFANNINIATSHLVPLLGRNEPTFGTEQWIFPNLQFTCQGTVTKWTFKGSGDKNAQCRVEIGTWRIYRQTSLAAYERVSTTDRNTANITVVNGSIFTYELATPVLVQRGDFVGAEIFCPTIYESAQKINVLGLRNSGNGSASHGRSQRGSLYFLQSSNSFGFQESDFLPLIQAVMREQEEPNIAVPFIPITSSPGPVDRETTALTTDAVEAIDGAQSIDAGEAFPTTNNNRAQSTDAGEAFTTTDNDRAHTTNGPDLNGNHNGNTNGLNVTLITAICGGIIIALIAAVIVVCVSVILVKRCECCVFAKSRLGDKSQSDGGEQTNSNSIAIPLQDNSAYNQIELSDLTNTTQGVSPQRGRFGTQSEVYEEIDSNSVEYETVSIQAIYSDVDEKRNSMTDCAVYVNSDSKSESYEAVPSVRSRVSASKEDCKAYVMIGSMSKPYESYGVVEDYAYTFIGDPEGGYCVPENHSEEFDNDNAMKMSNNIAYDHSNQLTASVSGETMTNDLAREEQKERNSFHHEVPYVIMSLSS